MVSCIGLHDRTEYVVLHNDIVVGGRSAKKLWEDGRKEHNMHLQIVSINTICQCCFTFVEWKKNNTVLARKLLLIADQPVYYQLYPDKCYGWISKNYTIHALSGATLGEVMERILFTCDACGALAHGKTAATFRI